MASCALPRLLQGLEKDATSALLEAAFTWLVDIDYFLLIVPKVSTPGPLH